MAVSFGSHCAVHSSFDLLDLRRYSMIIAHTGAQAVLHLTDQRLHGQLGIADERIPAGTSLFRSAGSSVAWMMTLPDGMDTP